MGNSCCLSERQKQIKANRSTICTMKTQSKDLENSSLIIQFQSWITGLYKTPENPTINHNVHAFNSCFIAKKNVQKPQKAQEVQLFRKNNLKDYDFVFSINKNKRYFQISSIGLNSSMWQKISSPLLIEIGDVLKIGRGQFQLKNLVYDQKDFQKPLVPFKKAKLNQNFKNNIESASQCRICLQAQTNSCNPLLISCQCIGSLEFIHLQCMKNWLKVTSDQNKRQQNSLIVNLSKSECQICKKSIINSSGFQELMYSLILNQKDLKPPMLLLQGTINIQNKFLKSYCFYSFAKKNLFQIGRNPRKTQMSIENDKTVSKTHASLLYNKNSKTIIVQDLGSTFGTFKKIKKEIKISSGDQKQLLIKHNIVKFKIKQNFNSNLEQTQPQIRFQQPIDSKENDQSFERLNKINQ